MKRKPTQRTEGTMDGPKTVVYADSRTGRLRRESNAPQAHERSTMSTQTANPKPLTKAQLKAAEAAGQKVYGTRDGKSFASRQDRRAYRAANKDA